jgi:hypothetical protein
MESSLQTSPPDQNHLFNDMWLLTEPTTASLQFTTSLSLSFLFLQQQQQQQKNPDFIFKWVFLPLPLFFREKFLLRPIFRENQPQMLEL